MSDGQAGRALRPVQSEPQDVGAGFVVRLLAFIGVVMLLLLGLAYWIFPGAVNDQRFAAQFPGFPQPRLQPSPRSDMEAFYREDMQCLNGTGWIDRKAGVVHIPIAQAMRSVAAHGIPGWPAGRTDVRQGGLR